MSLGSKQALSDRLMQRLKQSQPQPAVAERVAESVPLVQRDARFAPLSLAQQRLWLIDRMEPNRATYNMLFNLRLDGRLRPAVMARALSEIRARHEVLRTTFELVGGEPHQHIRPATHQPLPILELAGLSPAVAKETAERVARILATKPFVLKRGPMLHTVLLRLGEQQSELLLSIHHIVFDGWSIGVLVQELGVLYSALLAGRPSPLPPLPLQYADYAERQRQELSGDEVARQLEFWVDQIGTEPPPLELPTDRPRPAVMSQKGSLLVCHLPTSLIIHARKLAGQCRTSPFFVIMALFQVLLARWAGVSRVLVGTPVANRAKSDLHSLIGFLINAVVVPGVVLPRQSVVELITDLRQRTVGLFENQDVSFERLVEALGIVRDSSRTPVFQAGFMLGPDSSAPVQLAEGLIAQMDEVHTDTSKWDLMMALEARPESLFCTIEYATDLFDATTIQRLARQFECLAGAALTDPQRQVGGLPLLPAADRHQVLVEWNDTEIAYPREATVAELVDGVATAYPDRVALVEDDHYVTYGALLARARRFSRRLTDLGAGPESLVAIAAPRSIDLVVGLLAILEAGAAYLPLDPGYPAPRLAMMVEDSRAEILVTQQALLSGAGTQPLPAELVAAVRNVVLLDEAVAGEIEGPAPPLVQRASAFNLAYATYTSGSTGRPKAVLVTHHSTVRLITGVTFSPQTESTVHLLAASISFDAATFEIWNALASGGRVVVAPAGQFGLSQLSELVARHRVSDLFLTAGLFHQMVAERLGGLDTVPRVMTGGEVVSKSAVTNWLQRRADHGITGTLVDVYGPTECTTYATGYPMRPGDTVPATGVPIGRPIGNTHAYIVDERMATKPIGAPGALLLGGDGLARGYLNRPALTAERFVPDPLSGQPGSRLYVTGDRARWRPDGTIDFLGRLDRQVKFRGFRIEPGEVEAVIGGHPAVTVAHLVPREDRVGDMRLVAYVEPVGPGAVSAQELRQYLEQKVPHFMIPSAFVIMDRIPLNTVGKLDRDALPPPEGGTQQENEAPRTELEIQIAEIWTAVLGAGQVGLQDSFWELGGHSLLAAKVLARLEEMLGIDLPIQIFFDSPKFVDFTVAVGATLLGEEDE